MNSLSTNRVNLFDELFRDVAPGFFIRPLHGDPLPQQIKVDVKESPENFIIHAELAGVSKEDIHVDIDGPVVTLRAEVKQFDSGRDERSLKSERYFGAVTRSFQLPVEIDEEKASAKFENGILLLNLPKKLVAAGARRLRVE